MDKFDLPRIVSLEVVWVDEDLIELAATVNTESWRGRCTAYTVPTDIRRFSQTLLQFANGGPPTAFNAGADDGIGLISFRFYRIDRSGHIACYAQLASSGVPTDHRPEEIAKLAVEIETEAWAVIQFARQLEELARTRTGRASLAIKA